ncbi:MAG: N-6 DNA methylase [Leptospiraceae bacterium]|nr:N-6 DNA methylase [Leptospiraceae bacterium]
MINKVTAYKKISELVERFADQYDSYKKSEYNETQTRRDFIDPFWKALGWDIDNENGYAESYREVIHEDRVKVGKATKAPDYSFRLVGGKRLFFLEAKKPSVLIKDEIAPAYQVRRYGWSAKMPISVITDFEEFAIYDCSTKPKETDKASNGRIKYLTYENYISEFDFIWDTFAKERVLRGSFDKYITSDKNKKGTSTVDNEFLQSLDKWRVELAVNIALRNKNISEDELNFIVQHTIDRIIFLRIAEDRSVEPYGDLQTDIKTGDFYKNLLFRFHQADQKYNSGLFDFAKDKISDKISIDNKVIKSIISELYYPICPYEFSVLSVEILGSAYEQFLGKKISLSKSGKATIEEKPEVRKAGGVYYTPQYIVDYIVKNTIGKLVENKTPKEISKIKIADPACGSGSFLIGAYQFLLDWHKDFYTQNGKQSKGNKDNPLTPTGELTTAEKKRILLNNIYGVDLDSNAVEVTKLSLLLKCMEGETKETIEAQTKLFHDRILPTLDNNIKSGNSLIDLDYYDNELDFGEERKVKPFSWQKAFPEVFKQGGFDCIVGNPPYGADYGNELKHYLSNKFHLPIPIADTYLMFLLQAFNISKQNACVSYIIPSTWLYMPKFNVFRERIITEKYLSEIQLFRKSIFEDATVETCTIILHNEKPNKKATYSFKEIKDEPNLFIGETQNQIQLELLNNAEYSLVLSNKNDDDLFNKIRNQNKPLKEVALTVCGLTPYRVGKGTPMQTEKIAKNRAYDADFKKDKTYRQYLMGRDFNKYQWCIEKERWISYGKWLAEPRYKAPFDDDKKIVIRQTSDRLIAHLDTNKYLSLKNVHNLRVTNSELSYEYLLAIINSKLLDWWYQKLIPEKGRVFAEVKVVNLEKLPIKIIDTKNNTEIQKQNEIIKHVETLLKLNADKQNTTLPSQLEMINNRIDHAESKINELVYQLYELTEEEIKIVEERSLHKSAKV